MTWMIVDVFLCVWLGSSPAERVEVDFASIR
jgi:hypothetical protein